MATPMIDISIYVASLVLIGGYQFYLRFRLRNDNTYTIQSINKAARVAWVDNIMSDKNRGLLGVQTLRNSTMAATFLASTAILMSMGVLNMMNKGTGAGSVLNTLQSGLFSGGDLETFKLVILLATFIWAFFSFSMAVRLYNHVGYLINSRNSNMSFSLSTGYVSNLLNRSGKYYSYGMRAYYISVPMLFSLHSTYYMLVASIGLVIFLYRIDRTPKGQMPFNGISPDRDLSEVVSSKSENPVETSRTANKEGSSPSGQDGREEGNAVVVN